MPVEIKDYSPNSDKHKNDQTNYTKPVLTGRISTKRTTNTVNKAKERAETIKRHAIQDVLLPGLKDAAWDIFSNALSVILYGESRSAPRRGRQSPSEAPFTSSIQYSSVGRYNSMQRPYLGGRSTVSNVRPRPENDLGIFTNEADAYTVLDAMREIVACDGVVSVQTLFDICDQTAPYTATRYGWKDLEDARVDRVRDGWVLSFPRSLPID